MGIKLPLTFERLEKKNEYSFIVNKKISKNCSSSSTSSLHIQVCATMVKNVCALLLLFASSVVTLHTYKSSNDNGTPTTFCGRLASDICRSEPDLNKFTECSEHMLSVCDERRNRKNRIPGSELNCKMVQRTHYDNVCYYGLCIPVAYNVDVVICDIN